MENKFKFLTKHSLNKKIKSKWFLIANVIILIIMVGLVNIDSIVKFFGGDFNKEVKIKIVDNAGYYDEVSSNLKNLESYITESKLKIIKENDIKKAKEKIKNTKDILLVLNTDESNYFNAEFITDSYIDNIKYQSIISGLNSAKTSIALKTSNISQEDLDKISKSVDVKRSFISKDKSKNEENSRTILSALSLVIVLPCFMLIVFLMQMIGAEINEEKQTRGMEIIIGNVPVKVHFFSKVLASNLFVLIQSALLLCYGAIGLIVRKIISNASSSKMINDALNTFDLEGAVKVVTDSGVLNKLGYILPLIIILILLSFVAYSLLAGVLASMTTNMENYQQLQTPLMIISVIGYYLIFLSAAFPGSVFIKVIACIPLFSITLAPSLILSGEITVSIVIIGILLLLLFNYILIKFGLRIYKAGILNYSETGLWKKIFKAVKEG
ncbi:MAG: ABC transporter permease [Bacilli bacterium]|nr:ABC transporter permease [Bacilli bacterium]